MKLLKVNNQIYGGGPSGPLGPPGPHLGGVPTNKGPMVIMSNYDDVTDVSGLLSGLHGGPAPKRGVIANEGSINSGSD